MNLAMAQAHIEHGCTNADLIFIATHPLSGGTILTPTPSRADELKAKGYVVREFISIDEAPTQKLSPRAMALLYGLACLIALGLIAARLIDRPMFDTPSTSQHGARP